MDDDLITRLRDLGNHAAYEYCVFHEAADKIERLQAELFAAHERLKAADALAHAAQDLVDWVHNDLGADIPNKLEDLIEAYFRGETGND